MQIPFYPRVAVALCAVTFSGSALAQSEDAPVYQFKTLADLTATDVKDQCQTGTCWSFSTTSFLESEVARISGKVIDLSEMASVRHTYPLKAEMYLRHHGLHQFGPGSLCHDVLNTVRDYGLVPEGEYTGLDEGETEFNHGELDAVLAAAVKAMSEQRVLSDDWRDAVDGICDAYLGELPRSFIFENKRYTPESFRDMLGVNANDYVSITSFSHHPFGASFALEVPDNFSRGEYLNVALDELRRMVRGALEMGYTVAWDADVSENGFSFRNGMALLPVEEDKSKLWKEVVREQKVTQRTRQIGFENHTTTDDHLMHIVGLAQDQNGEEYFVIKNSWGQDNPYGGRQYVSMAYFDAKTIAVTMHQGALKFKKRK
ncbi:MAG: C1 family peptidase [Flavobacteriales bacterium]